MTQQITRPVQQTPLTLVKARMAKMIEALPPKLHKRFQQAAISVCMSPGIAGCTPESVATAIYICARLNLIPDPVLQEAHIVPFKDHGVAKATFIAGYKGLVKLARNSDPGLEIAVGRVYANDDYVLEDGLEPVFKVTKRWWEKPNCKDAGEFKFSYCVSRQGGAGKPRLLVLSAQEGKAIGEASKAGMKPGRPWYDNFEAMVDKTTVRRSAKLWTLDPDKPDTMRFRQAVALDENIDNETSTGLDADGLLDEIEQEGKGEAEKNSPPEGNVNVGGVKAAASKAATPKPGVPSYMRLVTQIGDRLQLLGIEPNQVNGDKVLAVAVGGVEVDEAMPILMAAKPADLLTFVQTFESMKDEQIKACVA